MSNPFYAHFNSRCQCCGDDVLEGEECFAYEDEFICKECAEEANIVCPECGNFKKPDYDTCYECYEENKEL
jgi:hypothetical protein